jgi:hypothetical protein
MEDRISVMLTMTTLCELHNREPRKELERIWTVALEDLTDYQIEKGLKTIIRERRDGWMPTPAEFIYYATYQDDQFSRGI